MKYITRSGKTFEQNTKQDKLLKRMYTTSCGRHIIKLLINPTISKLGGKFLSTRLSTLFIDSFIKSSGIDLSEYEYRKYTSYNDFFSRKIKSSCRPLPKRTDVLFSPCDGKIQVNRITTSSHFKIKNTQYTLKSLLKNTNLANEFQDGYLAIIRLTVDDYHRYHNIDNGNVISSTHIDGFYHTVNPVANDVYPIYKENTREYVLIDGDNFGKYIQMEVGALMVGKISNNKSSGIVYRGTEKGHFEFGGSTIILIFKKDAVLFDSDLINNTKNGYETIIKLGEKIGIKAL